MQSMAVKSYYTSPSGWSGKCYLCLFLSGYWRMFRRIFRNRDEGEGDVDDE